MVEDTLGSDITYNGIVEGEKKGRRQHGGVSGNPLPVWLADTNNFCRVLFDYLPSMNSSWRVNMLGKFHVAFLVWTRFVAFRALQIAGSCTINFHCRHDGVLWAPGEESGGIYIAKH